MLNKRILGNSGEEMACNYLIENGNQIIYRNYRIRDSEIDIIFKDADSINNITYLVFCEVKYRSTSQCGEPYEAVTNRKIRKICKAAKHYLYSNKLSEDTPVRFDIVSIVESEITHIKNAFYYTD